MGTWQRRADARATGFPQTLRAGLTFRRVGGGDSRNLGQIDLLSFTERAARSSGACPRRKPGDPRAVPQPAHRHRPASRINSALRERRVQTYSCRLLLNFDLLRSPSGSPRRAQAGTWLRAPRAEWALPFATRRRPRSILYADLPRCGAEPWARAKAVLRGAESDGNPGTQGSVWPPPAGNC